MTMKVNCVTLIHMYIAVKSLRVLQFCNNDAVTIKFVMLSVLVITNYNCLV